ncbi:MAG: TetR/AcrR family transcriptional regulator [Rikenellaceae bacterium]
MQRQQIEYIVSTACTMFVEHGIKTVRMDDIAKATKVSKRTLYEIFSDKEGLLSQAMKYYFARLDVERNNVSKDATNVLTAVLASSEFIILNSEVAWRTRMDLKRFYPSILEMIEKHNSEVNNREFKARLLKGIEEGLIRSNINIELAISMLRYVALGIVESDSRMALPTGLSQKQAFFESLVNFLRGIATSKGIELIDNHLQKS